MIRTISSAQTYFVKFIFPALWIAGFGAGVASVWLLPAPPQMRAIFSLVWLIGGAIIWRTSAPLKKVQLEGDALIVSNYLRETRVPLSEIQEVTENRWINIRPVTIRFRSDTEFGASITFMPKVRPFLFLRSHPIVAELRELARAATTRGIAGTGSPSKPRKPAP